MILLQPVRRIAQQTFLNVCLRDAKLGACYSLWLKRQLTARADTDSWMKVSNRCSYLRTHFEREVKYVCRSLNVNKVSIQRCVSSASCSNDEDIDEEENNLNFEDEKELLQDTDYDLYLREYCSIPGVGHRLYVIQPVMRAGPQVNHLTSGKLQLEEAVTLVKTIPRWTVVKQEMVNIRKSGQKMLFTDHQFQELSKRIREARGISAVFLSSNHITDFQLSIYSSSWGVPVFDRYTLVLQIFKERARTKEAKLQVALAEVPYIRSRLKQIQGGEADAQIDEARFAGGTGESYIQLRSKILQERETRLKKALTSLKKQRAILRGNRTRRKIPTVAVVGYTNSGKTTLIKALTNDKEMEPEDKLFATLDVTAHGGILPNHMKAIFIDTVGFISNIPVTLIAAFSATLEDAVLADIVIHVRDISHPDAANQKHIVLQTLRRMLTAEQMENIVEVANKVDKLPEKPMSEDAFNVSATTGYGLNDMCFNLQHKLLERTGHMQKTLRIPMNGAHLRWLYKEATVVSTQLDTNEENLIVNIIITDGAYGKFKNLFSKTKLQSSQ